MAPATLLLLLGALLGPSAAQTPAANASAAPVVRVTVGVLLPEDLRFPWAWPRVAPALCLALEALQPQLGLAGLAVRIAFASMEEGDDECREAVPQFKVDELRCAHHPDVLLGLSCFEYSFRLGDFAEYWRLPLFRAGLYSRFSSGLREVVYAGPLGPTFMAFQPRFFEHFNWTGRAARVFSRHRNCWSYSDLLWDDSRRPRGRERPLVYVRPLEYQQQPDEAIRYIQAEGRVAFICGPLEEFHQIMHLAHVRNMTGGDYVFIYLDLFGESMSSEEHHKAAKPWQSKESNDTSGLQEAFQTVLVITPHEPQTPEYWRFKNKLTLRAQRDFGVAINDSLGHLVAGCFHDVLLLYLRALNETLREGGTKRNTSHILAKMRSLKFQGVTGMVSINSDSDREMDFDLWAMRDVETGEFQVVRHYVALEKRINWKAPILWKKGAPPLDNPPCVFNRDDPSCVKRECVQGERDLPFISFCTPSLLPQELVPVY